MDADDIKALRAIGDSLREYREDFVASLHERIELEVRKVEAEGFDPARGRGRGPWWAEAA
jgi:hypothetical protein